MAFDDAQLGVADRNPLGPIVRDRDRTAILDGARAGRGALRWRLHIIVQVVETVRPAARRATTTFARQGHAPTLMPACAGCKQFGRA
jgi:hypothetical protein